MNEIVPIAMPGTHQKFYSFFEKRNEPKTIKILDMGAGHGAFTKKLFDLGYNIEACDMFPEIFHFDKIECQKVDITKPFPYDNASFDVVIAVEVSEHILDHEVFFAETRRILKPGGRFYISTPNILSLKSRFRFMFTGFYYSFNPLEMNNYDGLQHVCSMTLDQYNYAAVKHGFEPAELAVDRTQSTSKWLYVIWKPFQLINQLFKGRSQMHNRKDLLFGRLMFLTFKAGDKPT